MRSSGYWLAWVGLAIGTCLFLFDDCVARTTDMDGGTRELPRRRTFDWGPVATSIEAGTNRDRLRASYQDWVDRVRAYLDAGPEPALVPEYHELRYRFPRLDALNSIGWFSVVIAATGVVVSAWRLWRHCIHREAIVVLSTVSLAGLILVVRLFIERAYFFPAKSAPPYLDDTLSWHPIALGWFAWTAAVVAGHVGVLILRYRERGESPSPPNGSNH